MSSRTCTGPTRPRSTCCASSAAGSTTAPALLIASYRDDGLAADHRLRLALGDLAALRSTNRVRLDPLSAAGVRLLSAASGLDPAELFQLTGGNPFYITEVLQAGVSEVPAAARDAVLARAARLGGARPRELLDATALLGTKVEPALIEAVAPGSVALLDEILASGLLAEDGSRLRFRHEIARLTVEQAIPAHRRGPIHRRILGALGLLGSTDEARLAFHAEGAGDGPAVLRYATAAAQRAADLASHREAAAQYQRAVRFATDRRPRRRPRRRPKLYGALARETALVDQWAEAELAGARALELWRQLGDRRREGDTLTQLCRVRSRLCRGADAIAAGRVGGGDPAPAWCQWRTGQGLRRACRDADGGGPPGRGHRPVQASRRDGRGGNRSRRPQRRDEHPGLLPGQGR